MRRALIAGAATMVIMSAGSALAADTSSARAELAAGGTMRVAVVEAPTAGVFFVGRTRDGAPAGVTRDLGAALRGLPRRAGRDRGLSRTPARPRRRPGKAEVDVAFMPVDAQRRDAVAFGPAYYDLESTYLVTAASGASDVRDVDRAGMRVVGIANTNHDPSIGSDPHAHAAPSPRHPWRKPSQC